VFFNPDTFANWVNIVWGSELLPTTENFLPKGTGTFLAWTCLIFMWLETVIGFCVGCKIHALLVWLGFIKEECHACNNINSTVNAQTLKAILKAKEGLDDMSSPNKKMPVYQTATNSISLNKNSD